MRHILDRLLMGLALLALTACDLPDPSAPTTLSPKGETLGGPQYARLDPPVVPASASFAPADAAAQAFARSFLDGLQPRSIADRVEYCGYFYVTSGGDIAATPPRRGTFATCDMPSPRRDLAVFASYHTHGAFGRNYDNEVPSVTDLLSDFDFAIDGYVSTPGGRVWHVDYGTRSTRQVCGQGCVHVDPGFRPVDEATIRASYTLPQLGQRANLF